MQTIFDLKEQAVTDTPLLLFDCVLSDGTTEHWSTHGVTVGGVAYSARVLCTHTLARGDGGRSRLQCEGVRAQRIRASGIERSRGRRCAEDFAGAGERGFALFGDRTRDGVEGCAADGQSGVLRSTERGAVDGPIGDLPGDLQSA